ncbi:MAG: diaminopimelate decarboxylase [Pseudobdellovibrionaceae bacterium]|nr:diaminopimelate decarboxylase [Bdellovibrionales bacterium]USN48077.1 MAG: diaminopimelate decarboxylase [Pseudobdellovibrionaceae bacterium]
MGFYWSDNELKCKQDHKVYSVAEIVEGLTDPIYLYDLVGLRHRMSVYKDQVGKKGHVHYAVKANDHPRILKEFVDAGFGVDVVSGGEFSKCLAAGFSPADIVFSGVGKTSEEITLAISEGVGQINIECPQELERVAFVASHLGKKVSVAFRMNPDVDAETHPYIKTGFRENKFGMDRSFLPELERILAANSRHLELRGLTIHIGSQIRSVKPMVEAVEKTLIDFEVLRRRGFNLLSFDVGGGIGIDYESEDLEADETFIQEYLKKIREVLDPVGCEVVFEPGRSLVARFGVLLGEVQYIKKTPFKTFAILNTGMHHLMRPALYEAHHRIVPVKARPEGSAELYDVVGPICESADVLGRERMLPSLSQGDWLGIMDAGAYGAVMVSDYNSHRRPEAVFVGD